MQKLIPKKLKKFLRPNYYFFRKLYFIFVKFCSRKKKKLQRLFLKEAYKNSYSFVILCVKKTAYTDLIVSNINSLHYYNPTHKFTIHCDDICYNDSLKKQKLLDYKNQTEIINVYKNEDKPWQLFKVESLIAASRANKILVDADELWHGDLNIDKDKVIFQTRAYRIKTNQAENALMVNVFNNPGLAEMYHYVTGFLNLPAKFMTEKLANDCRYYTGQIFNNNLDFLDPDQRDGIRRLAEELGANIAIQTNVGTEKISVLKETDPKGDKNIMQSLYYGCANQIIK
jgi:hypothetical protein